MADTKYNLSPATLPFSSVTILAMSQSPKMQVEVTIPGS